VGSVRKGNPPLVRHISIEDPTMFFLTVLKETLERKGIKVGDNLASINSIDKTIYPEDLTPLLVHRSVQLRQILKELNKNSNNFYAEQILKTIGSEILNYGTSDNGIQACRDLFNQMGINPDNLVMADGSGLSRLNLATPRQLVNLLSYIYKTDDFETFYDSLPIAGVDGTLAGRMKKTAAEKNVRAKAGYNNAASALSGYLKTVSGEPMAFSIIVNNYLVPTSLAYYIQDNVCQRLINFSRN
jgi:D-alanyl-D-alanine carboxypeptidase/D-alanyl-D-alanine-endopeptidase (penicillin-binding protein 4)